jgi:hypothetical protein
MTPIRANIRWAARLSHQNQSFHRCLPFWGFVLGLWKFHDVVAGIFERDEGPPALQLYRIIERTLPTAISRLPPSTHSAHSAGAKNRFASANHNFTHKVDQAWEWARFCLLQRRPRLDMGAPQMRVTVEINLALGMILCAAMQTGQRFAVY